VKAAYRDNQNIILTDLEHMLEHADNLGMLSTVIIGNSSTFMYDGLMVNPRGYKSKYTLVTEEQAKA
jgi:precorrin-3B C17-methyltransferase